MDAFSIASVSDNPCVLVCGMRVSSLRWYVIKTLSMLTLIPSIHVDRLLKQVKIELLVASARTEIKIAIDECL